MFIDANPITMDEPFTIMNSQKTFQELFQIFINENNPPLHFILAKGWIYVFGDDVIAVRMLSVTFSCASVYLFYLILKKTTQKIYWAWYGLLLYTLSNYFVKFAHDFRVYPIFQFLTLLCIYLILDFYKNPRNKKAIILALVNAIMCYSHFFGFWVVFCEALFLLWMGFFTKPNVKYITWGILTFIILYLPYLQLLYIRLSYSVSNKMWLSTVSGVYPLYNMIWRFSNMPVLAVTNIVILSIGLLLFYRNKKFVKNETLAIYSCFFIVPYLSMYLISFKVPMFLDRYVIFIAVAFILSLVYCIQLISKTSVKLSLFVVLTQLTMYSFTYAWTGPTPSGQILNIKNYMDSTSSGKPYSIIMTPSWQIDEFSYHIDRAAFRDYKNVYSRLLKNNIFACDDSLLLDKERMRLLEREHLYLIDTHDDKNTSKPIRDFISKNRFTQINIKDFRHYKIYLYQRESVSSP